MTTHLRRYGLALLSSILTFLTFPGFDVWYLAPVAWVPLLIALRPVTTWKGALGLSVFFALLGNLGGFHWLAEFFPRFAGLPWIVGFVATLFVCLFQGGHLILFSMIAWWLCRQGVSVVLAAVVGIAAAETVYPALFPVYMGYSLHQALPWIQILDLGGPVLVSVFLMFINGMVADFLLAGISFGNLRWRLPVLLGVVLTVTGYGLWRINEVDQRVKAAEPLVVGMVQANMGIIEKREDPREGHLRHLEQSLAVEQRAQPDLIVWPESGFYRTIPRGARSVRRVVMSTVGRDGKMLGPLNTPLLFGGLSVEPRPGGRHYNTAFMVNSAGEIQGTFDKIFLLAFGEYLPFEGWFPWLRDLSPRSGGFSVGESLDVLHVNGKKYATFICYEDIVPDLVRRMVRDGEPDVLVNLTNDAWFGDTNEPWIHMDMAKFRAVEHHRFMVRSTNSGVSAFVDPVGRVLSHTGVMTRENLVDNIYPLQGTTLYGWVGNWPGWAGLAVLLWYVGAFVRSRYRKA